MEHLASLRRRHPFLDEYSDELISSTPIETLIKLESTTLKLKALEKTKDIDDRLASNRDDLSKNQCRVEEGLDDRWTNLHPARFLPGAGCSATRLWLRAREVLEHQKPCPISVYDMSSIGLSGYVTPRGWVELHDPGSSNLQLRFFSINNCGKRVSSRNDSHFSDELSDIAEMGELKCALRVLREAMAYVHPWNKSISALEGFLLQNNFCQADLEGLEKKALLLSQFIDYVLRENSNKWRGSEPFLVAGVLKGTWESFFGARPQSMLSKTRKPFKPESFSFNRQERTESRGNNFTFASPNLFYDDICVMWNLGKCIKPPGVCATKKGRPLRHVCNFRPDPSNPSFYCGANHAAYNFHK